MYFAQTFKMILRRYIFYIMFSIICRNILYLYFVEIWQLLSKHFGCRLMILVLFSAIEWKQFLTYDSLIAYSDSSTLWSISCSNIVLNVCVFISLVLEECVTSTVYPNEARQVMLVSMLCTCCIVLVCWHTIFIW